MQPDDLSNIPFEDEPAYQPGPVPGLRPNGPEPPTVATTAPADINSLDLADEELAIDETASAFDFPPPPPEAGNPYLAKLVRGQRGLLVKLTGQDKAIGLGDVARFPGAKIQHIMAHVEIRLQQDKSGSESFKPSSGKDPVGFDNATTAPYGSSCRIVGILKEGLRRPLPEKQTHRTLAGALWEALAGEPLARVQIQWKAYCKSCNTEVRGERNFPQRQDGSHSPVVACPKCKNDLNANWQPVRYLAA
jgi:hypothetical protein